AAYASAQSALERARGRNRRPPHPPPKRRVAPRRGASMPPCTGRRGTRSSRGSASSCSRSCWPTRSSRTCAAVRCAGSRSRAPSSRSRPSWAFVLAADYTTDYFDPFEWGVGVVALLGIVSTLLAYLALQRYLLRRVP